MKYRKKPALIEATQWFRNGDHPEDQSKQIEDAPQGRLSEGKVVRFFRSLHIPGGRFCPDCGKVFQHHGIVDGLNGEETVCPGDYVVTHPKGHYYVVKTVDFEGLYEPYQVPVPPQPKVET